MDIYLPDEHDTASVTANRSHNEPEHERPACSRHLQPQ